MPSPQTTGPDGIGFAFHRRATVVPPSRCWRGSAYRNLVRRLEIPIQEIRFLLGEGGGGDEVGHIAGEVGFSVGGERGDEEGEDARGERADIDIVKRVSPAY